MKCLVTKLDAVVDDNTLPLLTGVIMQINSIGATPKKRILSLFSNPNIYENGTITIKTLDGSNMLSKNSDFSNPTNKVTLGSFFQSTYKDLYCLEGEFYIHITTAELSGMSIADGGSEISSPMSFSIDALKYTNITSLSFAYAQGITGSIENLPSSIIYLRLMDTNVSGDIISLGKCINMNYLNIFKTKDLTGDIADLAQAMVDNGRTSGSMTVVVYGSSITVNGKPSASQSSQTVTFSSNGFTIS